MEENEYQDYFMSINSKLYPMNSLSVNEAMPQIDEEPNPQAIFKESYETDLDHEDEIFNFKIYKDER